MLWPEKGDVEVLHERSSLEPPGVELDAHYYGAGEPEGRLRLQIEDDSDDAEETPSRNTPPRLPEAGSSSFPDSRTRIRTRTAAGILSMTSAIS